MNIFLFDCILFRFAMASSKQIAFSLLTMNFDMAHMDLFRYARVCGLFRKGGKHDICGLSESGFGHGLVVLSTWTLVAI